MQTLIILLALFALPENPMKTNNSEIYINEIRTVEADFNKMATKEGLKKAFLYYADENAVLNRGNKIIKGKAAIAQHFDDNPINYTLFNWQPTFIEVSESGDMAYTYGDYQYEALGKDGKVSKGQGIFHTVWKKQTNGQWRYVWD